MNRLLTVFVICALLAACATNAPQTAREAATPLGIELSLTEVARDGEFEVYPGNPFHTVDVNATLRLDFDLPPTPEGLEADEDWVRLAQMLERWNELAVLYQSLAERAAQLEDATVEDTDFTAAAQNATREIVGLLRDAVARQYMSRTELTLVMVKVGAEDGDPYAALVRAINRHQRQLSSEAEQFGRSLDKYKAVVRAAVVPRTGGRQALHVPGWDKLPQGDYNPYDPEAILPNPAESQRLQRELEGARLVVDAHRELSENSDSIRDQLDTVLKSLDDELNARLDAMIAAWKQFVSISSLDKLPGDSGAKAALKEITDDLDRFDAIGTVIDSVRTGKATPQNVLSLLGSLQSLMDSVKEWPNSVGNALAFIDDAIADQNVSDGVRDNLAELKQAISADLTQAGQSLQTRLPNTVSVLKFFSSAVRNSSAIDSIDPSMEVERPLTDIQSAELDLRYGGVTIGDQIEMTVELRPVNGGQAPMPVRYSAQVNRTGWHRRYSGDVYFVRALDGPTENNFQSNVGLSLEWHNWERDKPNGWFNRVDPGFGLHAAFLNQDQNESIEFGGGINVSVFDGLIRFGYGYNISVEKDREYWFVGFGLFSMLGQMRDFAFENLPSAPP